MSATEIRNGVVAAAPPGWQSGLLSPGLPGAYERISLLGTAVDWWDGDVWRRTHPATGEHHVPGKLFPGIACANQALPWREAGH